MSLAANELGFLCIIRKLGEGLGCHLQVGGEVASSREEIEGNFIICTESFVFPPVFLPSPATRPHSQMKPFSLSCPRSSLSLHGRADSL